MPQSSRYKRKTGWLHKMATLAKLKAKYGKEHHKRLKNGIDMVAAYWQRKDGSANEFSKFCEEYFITDPTELEKMLEQFDGAFEQIFGMGLEIYRTLHKPLNLDTGPISKWHKMFVRYDPFSALHHALYDSKIAFVILLNFASYSTEELFVREKTFTERDWLECRLTDHVRHRMDRSLEGRVHNVYCDAEEYISDYNIYSSVLVGLNNELVFTEHKKLLSHWGIRDEIRAQYFREGGRERQETLCEVMRKIIIQKVPEVAVDNPDIFWDPFHNRVFDPHVNDWVNCTDENNARYKHLQRVFLAERATDRHYSRNFIERSFVDSCEIPEKIVEELLVGILSSPLAKEVAGVVKKQLGRKLLPFDIWYKQFVRYDEKVLDPVIKRRYPNPEAFHKDIPKILKKLGFDRETAKLIGDNIQVDACRGSGHAWGAGSRENKTLLRTRFEKDGMNFQGFDVGMHELGHCAEIVMNLHLADKVILEGLPNFGFSEAFAFLFERQKLDVLGIKSASKDKYFMILDTFWDTFEIAGVALLDIHIWRWMYRHKDATPEDISVAVRALAKNIWNKYFAPVLGIHDEYILAIYSHIIGYGLYMPNYAIGSAVTFQVLDYCRGKHWPSEMKRMCRIGALTPNAWLTLAVGGPLSLEPMFKLVKEALVKVK